MTPQSIRLNRRRALCFQGVDHQDRVYAPSIRSEDHPVQFDMPAKRIIGPAGELPVLPDDLVVSRLAMLIEGQCEGLGAAKAAEKLDLSKQRYFQLLKLFREHGSAGLQSHTPGPKRNHVPTKEVVRQLIRPRFLATDARFPTRGNTARFQPPSHNTSFVHAKRVRPPKPIATGLILSTVEGRPMKRTSPARDPKSTRPARSNSSPKASRKVPRHLAHRPRVNVIGSLGLRGWTDKARISGTTPGCNSLRGQEDAPACGTAVL